MSLSLRILMLASGQQVTLVKEMRQAEICVGAAVDELDDQAERGHGAVQSPARRPSNRMARRNAR